MASKLRQNKNLVPVRCPVKGYTQIVVYIRADNLGEVEPAIEAAKAAPEIEGYYDPRMAIIYRILCLTVVGYEGWNLPYPAPTSDEPMSYAPMFERSPDLVRWIMNVRHEGSEVAQEMVARALAQK